MNIESKKNLIIASLIILFGMLSRLLTFIPNFSALESIALFSGAYILRKHLAFIIPIVAMFVSDLIINNTIARVWFPKHDGLVIFADYMIWNVLSLVLIVFIGKFIFKNVANKNVIGKVLNFIGGVLGATLLYWTITNFGTWLSSSMYAKSFAGLVTCFGAAVPFLKNSLIGNFVFATVIFGSFEAIKAMNASKNPAKQIPITDHLSH